MIGGNNGGVSGFDMGRNDIYKNWVQEGDHGYGGAEYWGNTQPMQQCDGGYSWGDGWVYFVEVPEE